MVRLAGGDWGSDNKRPRANCNRAGTGWATRAECGKSVGLVAKPFTQCRGNKRAKARVGVGRARAPGRGWGWDKVGTKVAAASVGERKREREKEKEKEVEVWGIRR